jgi:regulatory protein
LDYLAKREYSYKELGQKLKTYADENDDIPGLLDEFREKGWLSDARFTEQIVHARKAKFGSARVAHELREKGIGEALISEAVAAVKSGELEHATEIWRKKYSNPPKTREEWAKQARFLQSRGFGFDIIKKVLNTQEES